MFWTWRPVSPNRSCIICNRCSCFKLCTESWLLDVKSRRDMESEKCLYIAKLRFECDVDDVLFRLCCETIFQTWHRAIGLGQFSTVLSCTSCGCHWFQVRLLGKLQLPEIAMFYCCLQKLRISKVEEKEAQAGHGGKQNNQNSSEGPEKWQRNPLCVFACRLGTWHCIVH